MMRRTLIPLLLSLLAGWSVGASAQTTQAVPEYTMKAAYLYNFALLTTWPVADSAVDKGFNLCFYGQDEFGPALDKLNAKMSTAKKSACCGWIDRN